MDKIAAEICLPWPPTVNTYWRHVGPRVLISEAGRAYRATVQGLVLESRIRRVIRAEKRFSVAIDAHPPDYRRRDIDNILKALLDALTYAGVWDDDSQIDHIDIRRKDVTSGQHGKGRVICYISEINAYE